MSFKSQREAVVAFAAFLSTQPERIVVGSECEVYQLHEALDKFCSDNDLEYGEDGDLILKHDPKELLKEIIKHLDDGLLVRNTKNDLDPGWAMRGLPLYMTLKKIAEFLQEEGDG